MSLGFDVANKSIRIDPRSVDPKVKNSIDFAYNRILKFHKNQKFKNLRLKDSYNNLLEYKFSPIESVGIYVPSNLPSTLLMNAIPAKLANVKQLVLFHHSPANDDQTILKIDDFK